MTCLRLKEQLTSKRRIKIIQAPEHIVVYITDTYQLTLSSDLVCTHSLYDPFYSGKDQKVKRINTTLSKAGSREKRGIRQERKKRGGKKRKGKTSKEEEDMMEQARGRSNQTPTSYTHTYSLHVTHMSEKRANPS